QTRERLLEDLQILYGLLSFLSERVLIEVKEPPSRRQRVLEAYPLRGVQPEPDVVRLEIDPAGPSPEEGDVYLLDPGTRRGLRLGPVFVGVGRQVCGLAEVDAKSGELRRLVYQSFTSEGAWYIGDEKWAQRQGSAPRSEGAERLFGCDLGAELGRWLGADLLKAAFGVDHDGDAQSAGPEELRLADESWEELLRIVRPPEALTTIGGRYRITGERLHSGRHADVYPAEEEGRESAGRLVAHILRAEAAADPEVRDWFVRRADAWRLLSQDPAPRGLLVLHERSDPRSDLPRPFLICDCFGEGRSLASELDRAGELPDDRRVQVLRLAGELCVAAHQKGLRLGALPAHHFLTDESGRLRLTGFEAAIKATEAETLRPTEEYWRRFVDGWTDIAPEARRGEPLAPTVDIYALGVLAEQLRPKRARGADPASPAPDAWQCLEYHCLHPDPHLRFQTAAQFLTFLDDWVAGEAGQIPQTVPVPAGRARVGPGEGSPEVEVPAFRIGKYPVTNSHFERFCLDTNGIAPADRQPRRLRGPWCPVVGVSLSDAQQYCEWLSRSTRRVWRVPSEAEWVRAAWGDAAPEGPYPWGAKLRPGCANYGPDYGGPTVVGAFARGESPTGCLDMGGNVWEWCIDHTAPGEPLRVLKGGAHDFPAGAMAVSGRRGVLVTHRSPHVGFRVICEEE
ncbi:MAG: hypothetical protein FJX74_06440, partial [Armatimonadetes bacterium]|nr:hypothetical protein [Armatimonadota bacterium]